MCELEYRTGHSVIRKAQLSLCAINYALHFLDYMSTLYKMTKSKVSSTKPDFVYVLIHEVFIAAQGHSHFFKSSGHNVHFLNRKEYVRTYCKKGGHFPFMF